MRARYGLLFLLWALAAQAFASGPRFVTGPPFFTGPQGVAIGWKQPHLLYYTDPGDLSASVSHQAADALVEAAARVWNVPVASIAVSRGGTLAEHVSGRNVYLDSTGMVFPADVMSGNAAAIPLAVIYDTDGSVTDTLLGAGASDPAGCRQNGVTESVDGFDPAGYITHAIIVLNGRCTGPAPEMQLQMRYQLMRIFGRVLGVAWSQTNDNVFTGLPAPTNAQALNWPIMHPIDILCGPYTYQCLPNPFQLRTDDIAGLVSVYSIEQGATVETGKQVSLSQAQGLEGWVTFPDGQGMSGVNVLVRRQPANTTISDSYYEGSAVSGAYFRQAGAAPFSAASTDARGSMGATDIGAQGRYQIAYFPLIDSGVWDNLITSTEPVNPLYTGEYALGPYAAGAVLPAGTPPNVPTRFVTTAGGRPQVNITVADAPPSCSTGGDGTFAEPMQAPATGWWNGLLCGYGHASYISAAIKAGHTFTLEVTALDTSGQATQAKAMPLIALYDSTDTLASAPSLGLTPSAFQSKAMGTTTLTASFEQASSIKFGIADARGEGRPDFSYQARLFYADSVSPSRVSPAGGTVTILGSGFRAGNAVTINGAPAVVLRWSANEIVLSAPAMAAAHAADKVAIDVSVSDRFTGATTTITGGLTYDSAPALPDTMRTLSAPSGTLLVNDVAPVRFSVQTLAADGVTPRAGEQIAFSVSSGTVRWSACATAICTVATDAQGIASVSVTPTSTGPVTLQASDKSLSESATFTVEPQASAMVVLWTPESPITVGNMSSNWFGVQLLDANGRGVPGRLVTFTVAAGQAQFDGCFTSVCTLVSNEWGAAGAPVMPLAEGPVTVKATSGDVSQTASFTAQRSTDIMQVISMPNSTFFLGDDPGTFAVKLLQSNLTPDHLQPVVFSAPPGVLFGQCGSNTCTRTTGWDGQTSTYVVPPSPGTYTITASYGDVQQSATFTVLPKTRHLNILTTPEDNVPVLTQATRPFSVQFVENDGVTPITGGTVTLEGAAGTIRQSACPFNTCEVALNNRGIATTWITPLVPGPIALSASYEPFAVSTSFVAVGGVQAMHVVQQPGNGGAPVGVMQTVGVQVLGPDGVTPVNWDPVTFSVVSGPFALVSYGRADVQVFTDNNGVSSCAGLALGFGPVVMQATDGSVSLTIRFMAGSPPDVLKLVSLPANDSPVGKPAATPFAVRAFANDGVTPAPNKTVVFSTTAGSVQLGCGAVVCSVVTDNSGTASLPVTPLAPGSIGLLAVEGAATQAASFTSITPADSMRLVSTPASGGFAGVPASGTFSVQVLGADGLTPAAGRNVTVSVTNANGSLAACAGAASCTIQTDSQGIISTQVIPRAPGPVTLLAAENNVTQTASFTAAARPDVLRIVSAPGGTQTAGAVAQPAFAVSLSSGDTGAPLPGRTIVFNASAGVQLAGCTGSPCVVVTTANGTAMVNATPMSACACTLTANSGNQSVSAAFTAVARPVVMKLISAPASGAVAGATAATTFSVQVFLADGVTPAAGTSVTLTVTNGAATLGACSGATSCTLNAGAGGLVSSSVTLQGPGIIQLLASAGAVSQSATFTAVARPDILQVVASPPATLLVGQTAGVFTVKLFAGDGTTPRAGAAVTFTLAGVAARLGPCGAATCTVQTGADGSASVIITPLAPGVASLTTSTGGLAATVSFTGVAQPDMLRIVSVPAAGSFTGQPATVAFSVRVLLGDGSTPAAGAHVTLLVAGGSASFTACGAAACAFTADSNGLVSTTVTPLTAGTILLRATDGSTVANASFVAVDASDSMVVAVAPPSAVRLGNAVPFAIRVLAPDGITPRAGKVVTFSASDPAATWPACTSAPCQAVTGPDGVASTQVVPGTPGAVTLTASTGTLSSTASFQALANSFSLTATTAAIYLAEGATGSLTLHALALKNGTPSLAQAVTWTGSASFVPAQTQSTTQADGSAAMAATVEPLAGDATAQVRACAWANICAEFDAFGVAADHITLSLVSGATQQISGVASLTPVVVQATDGAGHTVWGVPVSVYQTVTALDAPCPDRGRCPAVPILASQVTVVTTDSTGTVSIVPLDSPGGGSQTQIAVSAGNQGYATAILTHEP